MNSSHSSRFGYVMLLALLVLWPVMIFVRQRRRSEVYRPLSDEDFVLAELGIVGALVVVFFFALSGALTHSPKYGTLSFDK